MRLVSFSQSSLDFFFHPLVQVLEPQIESHSLEIDGSCPSENGTANPNTSFLDLDDVLDRFLEGWVLKRSFEGSERNESLRGRRRVNDDDVTRGTVPLGGESYRT